jgi:hypothetical protein
VLGPQLDLPLLCSSLGLRQPEVMKLLRGKTPLTLEQIHTITRVIGLPTEKVAETVRPLPFGLVVAAEHPRWRLAIESPLTPLSGLQRRAAQRRPAGMPGGHTVDLASGPGNYDFSRGVVRRSTADTTAPTSTTAAAKAIPT